MAVSSAAHQHSDIRWDDGDGTLLLTASNTDGRVTPRSGNDRVPRLTVS